MKIRETLELTWKKRKCYVFLAPYFLLFTLFAVIPVVSSMGLSFTYFNILEAPKWSGIDNYARLFFYDEVFQKALVNTLTLAIYIGLGGFAVSFVSAWMINELSPKLRAFIVLLLYIPVMGSDANMIWQIILSGDEYGLLNGFLVSTGLSRQPVQWLTNPKYMMTIVIVVSLWQSFGNGFLAFIAGLQGIDSSLYEAGAVDGIKNRWQELWHITLPSMKPQLLFGSLISLTTAFSVGEITENLFGNPSTDYTVHTIVNHLKDFSTVRFEMGYACAIATVLFVMMMVSNQFVQRVIRKVGS